MTDHLLLSEQELLLQHTVREFAERELAPRARELDEAEEFPWENVRGLAKLGLFGLTIDPAYGGTGGGFKELSIVIEELARACAATALIYTAHLSLATQAISRFGNEEQKRRFLPPLVKGEKLAAFALTEPGASSDAKALATTATRGKGQYVLNGSKMFISNGDVADTLVVFATHDRSLSTRGIDCFVVEKGTPGFTAHRLAGKMGMRASSTAELVFQDCPVPEENRLGEEGTGFCKAMQALEASRICIAAQCVGIGQACLEAAARYAQRLRLLLPPRPFQA